MTNPKVGLGVYGRAFADNVWRVRKALGLTVQQVADRARLPPEHVGLIETGRRRAHVDEIVAICRALDLPVNRAVLPSHIRLHPNRCPSGVLADATPIRKPSC